MVLGSLFACLLVSLFPALNPNLPLFPPFCQIWSPPSYATAHICHGLSTGTMETRHLSARTKLKCNSHFTLNVIIMRHSVMFLQKLLLFCYFLCLFANRHYFFILLFFPSISLNFSFLAPCFVLV